MAPKASAGDKPRAPHPAAQKPKGRGKKAASATFRNKVVVRRLPPTLPEAIFWTAVAPWVHDTTVDFKHYLAGKVKPDANKQDRHSRAYLRFIDPAPLLAFHRAFDGHIFRDSKGNESTALVEFAPFQRTPAKLKRKPDAKQATIDGDADYLAFVAKLEADEAASTETKSDGELLAHLLAGKDKEKAEAAHKTTPLLEYLRAAKAAKQEAAAVARRAKKAEAKAAAPAPAPPPKPDKGKAKEAKGKKPEPKSENKAAKQDAPQKPKGGSTKPDEASPAAKPAGKKKADGSAPAKPKPAPKKKAKPAPA